MRRAPWDRYVEPFRIFGNLYFVGTGHASTLILDTGDGLIMLDSGYQHSLYLVIHNMNLLGLSPLDLKYIVHTHGHIDHFGATRALVELTGAKTFLGAPDRGAANGSNDLSCARELGMEFEETFEPDVLLHDGDIIELGNVRIKAVATPGHTAGAMSYFFDVCDGSECFRAGLHAGIGLNTLRSKYLNAHELPFSLREDYRRSMLRLSEEKVDIYLGNHMEQSHTAEKAERLRAGDRLAFVAPDEWRAFNLSCIEKLDQMIQKEKDLLATTPNN